MTHDLTATSTPMNLAKKNPSSKLGLEAFIAVTHQGPAQGGKAGGSKLPRRNLSKIRPKFKGSPGFLIQFVFDQMHRIQLRQNIRT
ncbi:MAG: hypothetical protein OEW36_12245 [Hylemonella sp.]|nr:hypothetical protein [Hylemonella sp.]